MSKLSPSAPGDVPPEQILWQHWREGRQTDLDEFLPQFPGLPLDDLLAVLLVDQRERWLIGECIPVEAYLRRYPALEADAEAVVELAYAEWLLREEAGERPTVAEYCWRFPSLAARLRQQIELGRALDAPSN